MILEIFEIEIMVKLNTGWVVFHTRFAIIGSLAIHLLCLMQEMT